MRRTRIETLEKRAMFSVNPLVDASAVLDAKSAVVEESPADDAGVESLDFAAIKGSTVNINFKFETVFTTRFAQPDSELDGRGLANTLAGDFNGDGQDLGGGLGDKEFGPIYNSMKFEFALVMAFSGEDGVDVLEETIIFQFGAAMDESPLNESWAVMLLPYVEQDNLYKSYDTSRMTDITDGTSNTMMLVFFDSASPQIVQHGPAADGIIAVLIGLAVDPSDPSGNTSGLDQRAVVDVSPIDSTNSTTSLDVWEHANLVQPGATTNGIIAILIGLTADPSDPSGNTVYAASFLLGDGSVRSVGMEAGGATNLLASDEFFSRFAGARVDGEALMATTYGRGAAASQLTHDVEFESWADSPDWAPGYLQIELENTMVSGFRDDGPDQAAGFFEDLLLSVFKDDRRDDQIEPGNRAVGSDHAWGNQVNGILHEDNEFYFPRMITAK